MPPPERTKVDIDCLCAGILFADVGCAPIERVPRAGELLPTERIALMLGGCASNAALDLSRLGVRVGVSGCVGDDTFGGFIIDALASGGVDIAGVHRRAGSNTATTMIVNVVGEDRRFICTPGANSLFESNHIPSEWVTSARVFYVGGFLLLPRLEGEALVDLFRTARAAGAKTVLDVVYFGDPQSMAVLEEILPETDVFLPNDDEGAILTGLTDPRDQAERFRQAGAQTVVITQGERGSLLVTDGLRLRAGAYPTEFVGGTGSGDAFDAGYIAGLLAGEGPAGCLRWGSALGASCVRAIGATESVFTRDEALDFLRQHDLPIETF